MAFKISTGTRNALLSKRGQGVAVFQGATGGLNADTDIIDDSGEDFLTNGFEAGMQLYLVGATTAGNDTTVSAVCAVTVTAGAITLPAGAVTATEDFAATTTLIGIKGGSLADLFLNGRLDIYSGTQPSDADTAEAGTLLMTVTDASGAFVSAAPDNGLRFELEADCTLGEIEKLATQVWSGVGLAAAGSSGTVAGWWRLYANTVVTGASTSAIRIDGSCSGTSGQMIMSSTTIKTGQTVTVDTFKIAIPAGS